MSLKAALKAGLGAIDSHSSDGNNDFNKLNKPREFTGKLGALHSKGDVPEISAPEKKSSCKAIGFSTKAKIEY